ncbi:hypothetical protein [Vibrio crassostreae]|uniref:hypothetical protein n=1 Tax=Vibrio crassostreae TaxID=246167 RepID=UPI001052F312|nr:hypothetical protein [Vibrio crassostreae]TCT61934.1 hypothetical protein EDB31_13651 [Vibrio crassostreae]
MRTASTLFITSHNTGELLGTREANRDIKQPDRVVIPPYHTPNACPSDKLSDNEYWALLDSNGKPVRDYQDGVWVKKERQVKVTAYLKADGTQSKEFDDVSLIADDYTQEKPLTQWDEWNGTAWVTNQSNKYIAEYDQVDSSRRAAYRNVSEPLYMEALRKEARGLTDDAADFRNQADAAVELIKAEFPWPTQVEVS